MLKSNAVKYFIKSKLDIKAQIYSKKKFMPGNKINVSKFIKA